MEGGFFEKLENLLNKLKEGELRSQSNNITYNPQDDKLDIVAWILFKDEQRSIIIYSGSEAITMAFS